jgi:transglutaminase-like putative cysteine protease
MKQDKKYIPLLVISLAASLLPHTLDMPLWATIWCVIMWGYLLLSLRFGFALPNRSLLILLCLAGITGLGLSYGITFNSDAFVGLLAVMAALKPFETSTHRDRMITVFIAYFIIISSLLKSETLAITLYMFVSVLVTTAAMVHINDPYGRLGSSMKHAFKIMAQAIPLMVVMFLVFPRFEGSLIGLRQSNRAETGFSDQLRPGSVASLAENNEVAFRAEFDDKIIEPEKRYWRGVVFTDFNGHFWDRQKNVPEIKGTVAGKNQVAYTLTLEPHNQKWLFALDLPAKAPSGRNSLHQDFTVRTQRPVTRKKRYEMLSNTGFSSSEIQWGIDQALVLPAKSNPRARKLAAEIAANLTQPSEIVSEILNYFRSNNFSYTLNPPLLGRNAVDDFVFDSKKGYCEHYASAFAFLARAAGIPSRIAGGYLGGQLNPWGNYLIIRQSDAHAWAEVWYPDQGWTRVDPTLAVAPQRLEAGPRQWLMPGEFSEGFAAKYLKPFSSFTDQIMFGWDAISLKWDTWFSGYSRQQQKAALKALWSFVKSKTGFFIAFIAALGLVGSAAFIRSKNIKEKRQSACDQIAGVYEKFCKKMARAGVMRPSWMGPGEFAEFACRKRPDLCRQIIEITNLYISLRFAGTSSGTDHKKQLAGLVHAFKPKRPSSEKTGKFDFACWWNYLYRK